MKTVGMMRIKNEARWIERVLRSMQPACEHIFVFDDHSDDNTVQICESLKDVTVFRSPFEGIEETRDKNWLIEQVEVANPEWILHIDGDEEIAPGGAEIINALTSRREGPDGYRFQVLYLWDSEHQIRVDGLYRDFRRASLFQLRRGVRFHSHAGGGFHCGNVPQARYIGECAVKLLHYGYMHKADRIRKYEWYNAPDKQPVPPIEDGYRHMVIGDLFPAHSAFRHAGPLQLQTL